MSELGEKLQKAFANEKNTKPVETVETVKVTNINDYIWKFPKKNYSEQEEIKLVDATEDQLRTFYNHCRTMLYNTDPKNLGRVPLLREIEVMRDKCGVELFFRDSEKQGSSRFAIVSAFQQMISKNNLKSPEQRLEYSKLGDVIATESFYEMLPIDLIVQGGLDRLGRFDASPFTISFIIRQGIWLLDDELKNYAGLTTVPMLGKIKEDLGIKQDYKLRLDSVNGMSFADIQTALTLRSRKYSDMNSVQLSLLRYKLLSLFENQANFHIGQWKTRMTQIEEVAEKRNIVIK